jgi:hypothetical protein
MAVSETSGRIYDSAEFNRLELFMKEQDELFKKEELSKSVQTTKIVQYAMVLTGVVVTLYAFSRLVNKKK